MDPNIQEKFNIYSSLVKIQENGKNVDVNDIESLMEKKFTHVSDSIRAWYNDMVNAFKFQHVELY